MRPVLILFSFLCFYFVPVQIFSQKSKPELLGPGFYYFSQNVSEWVGGGYYILKPDSNFVFFSPLWLPVKHCGALDINPNYFGTGKWQIENNHLMLKFEEPAYNLLRFNSELTYRAESKGSYDSVYFQFKVPDSISNWFVEVEVYNNSLSEKITKPVVNQTQLFIALPASNQPQAVSLSAVNYYTQNIQLIAAHNYHSFEFTKLYKKSEECFHYVEKQIINGLLIRAGSNKLSYVSLLTINRIESERSDVLGKLNEVIEKYPVYSLVAKYIIEALR